MLLMIQAQGRIAHLNYTDQGKEYRTSFQGIYISRISLVPAQLVEYKINILQRYGPQQPFVILEFLKRKMRGHP